ncbi:MAG: exosortase H-associated membrane protein [Aliidongia sp.]
MRRYLVAWPFFFALALAPPRAPRLGRMLLIGFAVLVGLFILSAVSLIFVYVAVLVNHAPNPADRIQFVPPAFYVAAPHYSDAVFFLAGLAFYISSYVLPLLAPIMLWIGLNPISRRFVLGIVRETTPAERTG